MRERWPLNYLIGMNKDNTWNRRFKKENLALRAYKSRRSRDEFNLLHSYYLQPALGELTGQKRSRTILSGSQQVYGDRFRFTSVAPLWYFGSPVVLLNSAGRGAGWRVSLQPSSCKLRPPPDCAALTENRQPSRICWLEWQSYWLSSSQRGQISLLVSVEAGGYLVV